MGFEDPPEFHREREGGGTGISMDPSPHVLKNNTQLMTCM